MSFQVKQIFKVFQMCLNLLLSTDPVRLILFFLSYSFILLFVIRRCKLIECLMTLQLRRLELTCKVYTKQDLSRQIKWKRYCGQLKKVDSILKLLLKHVKTRKRASKSELAIIAIQWFSNGGMDSNYGTFRFNWPISVLFSCLFQVGPNFVPV